ncbi:uncharacterized protein EI90DRAFT_3019285 [Cantharellus anzutake]|uniref:uncharacterized protein n=1 Tax=Cantharellus anzutake TaxID=1750568 RepID=UPI00190332BC|nr:uncharacterized protein EI90DRAFT_3019285 [Cantharellus anzutake]KAF8324976.1 hypothetical protein EI90DRAFT_3019285 [Cantharellus anzutake]
MDAQPESGWHTDPENPMLGPDGKLRDAADKPDQFVFSPSDALPHGPHPPPNSGAYNPDDDLPTAHQTLQRPKWVVKQVTCENPVEAFEQQKLANKTKNRPNASQNKDVGVAQRTLEALLEECCFRGSIHIGLRATVQSKEAEQVQLGEKSESFEGPVPAPRPEVDSDGMDADGDDEVAPGADEDQEKFASEDVHVSQAIQQTQKAWQTRDLETVFTDVVHEAGKESYRICWVCQSAYNKGDRSRLLTPHFSASSASSTLCKHIGTHKNGSPTSIAEEPLPSYYGRTSASKSEAKKSPESDPVAPLQGYYANGHWSEKGLGVGYLWMYLHQTDVVPQYPGASRPTLVKMEAHQKLVPSHAAGARTTPPPPPSPTHHALQNTPMVTSTFDVDMIAHTLRNDPIPGANPQFTMLPISLSNHMCPPVTTPPCPQALTSSTSETLKRLRSPESAKIQGPTLAPPHVMFRVPANTDDPFLANYNTPVATTIPANIHPNPATTDTNSSTDPPRLTRSPAPTDAPAQATATTLRPLDDNPDYNYIDLTGELANFRAHGARPARILANINETHFNQWITTPRAILIYPLDAKHSPENDHKMRNDLTIFLTRAFPLSTPFIKVCPPLPKDMTCGGTLGLPNRRSPPLPCPPSGDQTPLDEPLYLLYRH